MNRLFFLAWIILASACTVAPSKEYRWRNVHGSGDFNKDSFECEGLAARTYPVANVTTTESNPFISQGSQTTCTRIGSMIDCQTQDPSPFATYTQTNDTNERNRKTYYAKCLAMKGWERYEVRNEERQAQAANFTEIEDTQASEKYIVEEGGYCNETNDCVRGLSCANNSCIKPYIPQKSKKRTTYMRDIGDKCDPVNACQIGLICAKNVCMAHSK